MTEGKRPGGLTALAVINFVWGGASCLMLLLMAALLPFIFIAAEAAKDDMPEEQQKVFDAMQDYKMFYIVTAIVSLVLVFLLIASGVGYLKQNRLWGRTMGSLYGLLGIASTLVTGMMLPKILGGGFGIGTIIGLVYPVLTLVLLNTTFKEDFRN